MAGIGQFSSLTGIRKALRLNRSARSREPNLTRPEENRHRSANRKLDSSAAEFQHFAANAFLPIDAAAQLLAINPYVNTRLLQALIDRHDSVSICPRVTDEDCVFQQKDTYSAGQQGQIEQREKRPFRPAEELGNRNTRLSGKFEIEKIATQPKIGHGQRRGACALARFYYPSEAEGSSGEPLRQQMFDLE